MNIIINGRFLSRQMTGVDRYASEIIREMDQLPGASGITLAVAKNRRADLGLQNIQTVVLGRLTGIPWEQIALPLYARQKRARILNLCNMAPLIRPGYVCIHDMQARANPQFLNRRFVAYYRFMFAIITRLARKIITVSEFSKAEIGRFYPHTLPKVTVIPNSWQHIERVQADDTIFTRYPVLAAQPYFFAMSSMSPNKNIRWIVHTAKRYPQYRFVIAGNVNKRIFSDDPQITEFGDNVLFIGRISDGQAKALMQKTKAFLFPSYYEGFGLPPIEAMACGATAVVSNASCLPEIFQKSVHYIDPRHADTDLDALLLETTDDNRIVLNRFSWKASAQKMMALITETPQRT